MQLRFGNYSHAPNSVALSEVRIRPTRTLRGRRVTSRIDWRFMGELIPDATSTTPQAVQDDLDAKQYALVRAYEDDYKDIGFYKDDGSLTSLYLATDHPANLTGNLVSFLTFPRGDGAEYAGKRTFAAGVHAEFADIYSQLTEYVDTMTQFGDGGPIYTWHDTPNGPVSMPQSQSSYVRYVHQGMAVAFDAWPLPPAPLASGANYLSKNTVITRTSPRKYSGFGRWGYYKVEWSYTYVFPTPQALLPVIR
jgi:hypothetical protein